jgi:hypothetical protein
VLAIKKNTQQCIETKPNDDQNGIKMFFFYFEIGICRMAWENFNGNFDWESTILERRTVEYVDL